MTALHRIAGSHEEARLLVVRPPVGVSAPPGAAYVPETVHPLLDDDKPHRWRIGRRDELRRVPRRRVLGTAFSGGFRRTRPALAGSKRSRALGPPPSRTAPSSSACW